MRVKGDLPPSGAFSAERQPNNHDMLLVRLYENVEAVDDGYEYDEYRMELPYRPGVEADISANVGTFLAQAIERERRDTAARDPQGAAEANKSRVEIEQSLTDQYLDILEAQQDITDLYLEIIGG